jgi:hypothetical protein
MLQLESYLQDQWQRGAGDGAPLHDPSTGEAIASATTQGLDLGAALDHARRVGGPAVRALTFAERGRILTELSKAIHAARPELLELSTRNTGTTLKDSKFDIDGATATLAAYGELGLELGLREVGAVALEALELVEGSSGVPEASPGDHGNPVAELGPQGREDEAHLVAHAARRVLVDQGRTVPPAKDIPRVGHRVGQGHRLLGRQAAGEGPGQPGRGLGPTDGPLDDPGDEGLDGLGGLRDARAHALEDLFDVHSLPQEPTEAQACPVSSASGVGDMRWDW